jgi:hypothetical protein
MEEKVIGTYVLYSEKQVKKVNNGASPMEPNNNMCAVIW